MDSCVLDQLKLVVDLLDAFFFGQSLFEKGLD